MNVRAAGVHRTTRHRSLVISDPENLQQIIRCIDGDAWHVEGVELGSGALNAAARFNPSVIIADARSHGGTYADLCAAIRTIDGLEGATLIVLTEPSQTELRLRLLEAGADSCWIEQPDSIEFRLRLKSTHRHIQPLTKSRILRQGTIEMDLDRYTVRTNGAPVQLTAMQLKVLRHFMENPGINFTRAELLEIVWKASNLDEGAVTACIARIRRALQAAGGEAAIRNIKSTGGYVFETDVPSRP